MSSATTISVQKDRVEFVIRLDRIQELFDAPEFDPFVEQARHTAGLDDIVAYLSAIPMRRPPAIQATLVLPPAEVTPELQAQTQAAVTRTCERKLNEAQQAMAASRFEGRAKLPVGLLAAVAAVAAFALIYLLTPDYLNNFLLILTPVITVIVWVSIWNPVETLLYDRWDERREQQIYSAIKTMAITIQAG